jgi:protein arginine N-methyltransferase 1
VEFVAMHSSRFTADERVDVIVHEQMGDFLFDEDMVTNVSDLRDRLLKPGGRIVPSLFELFIEPIEIQDGRRVPFIWELEVYGIDYRCMERERPQNPDYYRLSSCDLGVVHHFLAEREPALRIDLQTIDEASLPREVHLRRRVTQGGRLDGFAVYFRALVDEDLSLSSDPLDPARAPHWGYRILRVEEQRYEVGDQIDFHLNVERWAEVDTWRWEAERGKAEG